MSTCRVLVIRFSSIGDIVLTTPVLRALKTQLEGEVSVHFLTKSKFKEVVAANPHIDVVHSIENSVQEILPDLEQADFDYIIDLQNNLRSRIVRRRLKVLSFALRKLNIRKWILVRLGIDILPDQHIVDRYMECLSAFDVSDDGLGLDFFIRQGITSWPVPMKQPYIAMAIGAAHEGKKFSRARLEQLCQQIPYPIALLGGADDIETGKVLAAISPERIFNGMHYIDMWICCDYFLEFALGQKVNRHLSL
ncbi:MAG: glycosyltransferase family 9 protein [Flavobacteriales bacterium]